ncbi:SMP-30/gluconolactonase/LRE family protein [Aquamicrobium sp. LC103]|uniref:SMP-30/gluconolactonase/LRE family protein n=1 Tax=Aquamicrobium sp. LC103 TaxID=1120658 RepID=UPI00063ECEF7|nr:SMP-30/gluconolactonase/LRE family protein [Aquamicrobium sp. LC103]
MSADVEVLHHAPDLVGESPLWDAQNAAIWWVDIPGRALRRLDLSENRVVSMAMPFLPGALALSDGGKPVIAGGGGWYGLEADGTLRKLADAPSVANDMRMNDGVVDTAGRFWAGTVPLAPSTDPRGALYRLDRDGTHEALDGLRTQNGTAVSPDGRTFYLADSHPDVRTIWAFDLNVESGDLSNRRLFHRPERGRPDGAAIDAEGCYWFAEIDAGRIVRLNPDGCEIGTIELPVSRPTNLAFYDEDLSLLAVTSMSAGLNEEDRAREPLAGALLSVEAGTTGWPQPKLSRLPEPSPERMAILRTG